MFDIFNYLTFVPYEWKKVDKLKMNQAQKKKIAGEKAEEKGKNEKRNAKIVGKSNEEWEELE